MGNREKLIAELGEGRVALGSTTTGATLEGPGLVRPGGEGMITLGRHKGLEALVQALKDAQFDIKMVDELDSLLWGKLVINAAINPMTALLEILNGELLDQEWLRDWMKALANEVAEVAEGLGVALPFEDPMNAAEDVAQRTASNRSSMAQDVLRGAPTEIDAICGAVVRAGQELGVETPANRRMWEMVRAKVKGEEYKLEAIHEVHFS
jgi:2-dehydropantoate 2-reductase